MTRLVSPWADSGKAVNPGQNREVKKWGTNKRNQNIF